LQIILNADDFGRSVEINRAILQAHREGVLTSASLMVTGAAAEDAVAIARSTPSLAVGLHVVLVEGRSVLPAAEIPHLVDAKGRFRASPLRAGVRYLCSGDARRELSAELRAQFERFAATGLPLSHVDGHLHLHMHPIVFKRLLPLAHEFGARGIRLPHDRFVLAMRFDRRRFGEKAMWGLTFAVLRRLGMRRLRRWGLRAAERTYGLMQSGHMGEGYVLKALNQLSEPCAELYFHPTVGRRLDRLGPNRGDLKSLLSPSVRRMIEARQLQLATYEALRNSAEAVA
jgi:hopanoid biosynthesis associated protein HpnK